MNVSACCRFNVRVFREGEKREERSAPPPHVLIYLLFFIEGDVTNVIVPEECLNEVLENPVCTHNHNIKLLQLSN